MTQTTAAFEILEKTYVLRALATVKLFYLHQNIKDALTTMYVKLKIFSFRLPYEAIFGFVRKVKLKVRNIILIPTSIKFFFFNILFLFAHSTHCALILTLSP